MLKLVASLLLAQIAFSAYIPVFVMLPLDTITSTGLTNPSQLQNWLNSLKSANTDGITVDVWWGLVESSAQSYSWSSYDQLFRMIVATGLKIQPILDFHTCGGNVGDDCDIKLPSWVRSVGQSNRDIWYIDSQGHADDEYISLFVDNEPLFGGRTPVQIYTDFARSFYIQYQNYMGSSILEVEIGMGPAGEMRYPSYQLKYWNFCGVGEFQSYSRYALRSLQAAAAAISQPQWAQAGGPNNAGQYSTYLSGAPFFLDNVQNNYASPYGQFFLNWYSQSLIDHGDRILGSIAPTFQGSGVQIMGKVAGIHWWYKTSSHPAECTAGYYNTNNNNAYAKISQMFAKHRAAMDFTCLEMLDSSQPSNCDCGPQELVYQVKQAAVKANIGFGGENALPFYNSGPYQQIEYASQELGVPLTSFSYLRLTKDLVQPNNLNVFSNFVGAMHSLSVSSYMEDSFGTEEKTDSEKHAEVIGSVLGGSAALLIAAVIVVLIRRRRLARYVDAELLSAENL